MPLLVRDTTMTIDKELTMKIHRFIIQTLFLLGLWLGAGLQAQVQTGTVTYVYTDQQGTPLAEADANGNITATFDYAPYGSQALGTAPNGVGYTGHVNDPDSGLVYMQARYYDSATGRFLSVDPVGPTAGNTFNFGRYVYANNSPAVNTDPTGMGPGDPDDDSNSAFPHEVTYFGGNGGSAGSNQQQSSPPSSPADSGNSGGSAGAAGAGAVGTLGQIEKIGGAAWGDLSSAAARALGVVGSTLLLSGDTPATQFVVRGGTCLACQFAGGSGVYTDATGNLQNISVQTFPATSIQQLSQRQWVPNNQIGVTTVQKLLGQGAAVIPTPTPNNPYHATLGGITAQQAQQSFGVMPNPNPKP